jgi:hypothetical protein
MYQHINVIFIYIKIFMTRNIMTNITNKFPFFRIHLNTMIGIS